MAKVASQCFGNRCGELTSESLAFTVYVGITSTREINALKRAAGVRGSREHLLHTYISALCHNDSRSGSQFVHIVDCDIHYSLYYRAFGGYNHNLVVGIIECRTYAMGVAQCPYVTGSDGSAYYISAVPAWGCGAQDRRYVEIVLYSTGRQDPAG